MNTNAEGTLILICVFAAGLLVGGLAHQHSCPTLGPNQALDVIVARYERCLAAAPVGMDCTMVAMMVGQDIAKELGRKP